MIGIIECAVCDHARIAADCDGCNIYRLALALKRGELDWMMDENHVIQIPDKHPKKEINKN